MPALVREFAGMRPRLAEGVFLAETAVLVGDVQLAEEVSIWFGCVLRGDVGSIRIGARSNIQDLSLLHMSRDLSNVEVGEDVTIGHGVTLHGAHVGSGALIGMGSILLDNAVVGEQAVIGAGSLLTRGFVVPPRMLALGRPAKILRELLPAEWEQGAALARRYVELSRIHQQAQGSNSSPADLVPRS